MIINVQKTLIFVPNQKLGLETRFSNEKFQIWRLLRQFFVTIWAKTLIFRGGGHEMGLEASW